MSYTGGQFSQVVPGLTVSNGVSVLPLPMPPLPAVSELRAPLTDGFLQDQIVPSPTLRVYSAQDIYNLRQTNGSPYRLTALGAVDLGSGYALSFDPNTQLGRIQPAFAGQVNDRLDRLRDDIPQTFTGVDMHLMLAGTGPGHVSKQLLECTTLSISVHRVKTPVRATGYINAKGFARGGRTIAGTMILTQFSAEVLLRFLQTLGASPDQSKSDWYTKIDQLPPFDMTIFFTNESGMASYRRLLGIELVTDGVTYSSQDLFAEETIPYYAADMTPLLPLSLSSLWNPSLQDRPRRWEKTPGAVMNATRGGSLDKSVMYDSMNQPLPTLPDQEV